MNDADVSSYHGHLINRTGGIDLTIRLSNTRAASLSGAACKLTGQRRRARCWTASRWESKRFEEEITKESEREICIPPAHGRFIALDFFAHHHKAPGAFPVPKFEAKLANRVDCGKVRRQILLLTGQARRRAAHTPRLCRWLLGWTRRMSRTPSSRNSSRPQ